MKSTEGFCDLLINFDSLRQYEMEKILVGFL